jgi:hypothetical protein
MDVLNILDRVPDDYYDGDFLILLESHLTYFLNNKITGTLVVEPAIAMKYRGDLYGMLKEIGIPSKYHYMVMRINGYTSGADYKGDKMEFLQPDFTEIDLLKQIFNTQSA